MMSFAYDIIDPCDLIGIPTKYGLIRDSNTKNVPPLSLSYIYTLAWIDRRHEKLSDVFHNNRWQMHSAGYEILTLEIVIQEFLMRFTHMSWVGCQWESS